MNLLRIFSFLLFVYLDNSFKIGSYSTMIGHNRGKIKMGCDYFIEQNLWIHYNDDSVNCINLHRERGYYYEIYEDYDDDDMLVNYEDSSDSVRKKLKEYHLRPRIEPFVIYANHTFTNVEYSHKYSEMLHFEMLNHNYKTWDDINEIIVVEERFQRD